MDKGEEAKVKTTKKRKTAKKTPKVAKKTKGGFYIIDTNQKGSSYLFVESALPHAVMSVLVGHAGCFNGLDEYVPMSNRMPHTDMIDVSAPGRFAIEHTVVGEVAGWTRSLVMPLTTYIARFTALSPIGGYQYAKLEEAITLLKLLSKKQRAEVLQIVFDAIPTEGQLKLVEAIEERVHTKRVEAEARKRQRKGAKLRVV